MGVVINRVWVPAWEMECCGYPFEVGSTVSWILNDVLGEDEADRITHAYNHHDPEAIDAPPVNGIVRSIDAVFRRFARASDDDPVLYAVPGSEFRMKCSSVDRGTGRLEMPGRPKGLRFIGYAVGLTRFAGQSDYAA